MCGARQGREQRGGEAGKQFTPGAAVCYHTRAILCGTRPSSSSSAPPDGASIYRDGGHAPPSLHTPFPPRPSPLDVLHTGNEIKWKACDGLEPRAGVTATIWPDVSEATGCRLPNFTQVNKEAVLCTAQGAPRPPPALVEAGGCPGKLSRPGEATGSDGVVGETPDVSGPGLLPHHANSQT